MSDISMKRDAGPAWALALIMLLVGPAAALGGPQAGADLKFRPEVHLSEAIEGDDELASSELVRSGSGTAEDPFVIANWTFEQAAAFGLRITNTTQHVRVEDVVIDQHKYGVMRSSFCVVDDPRCEPDGIGFHLVNVTNVTVDGLRVFPWEVGIRVEDSSNVVFNDVSMGYPGHSVTHEEAKRFGFFIAFDTGVRITDSTDVSFTNLSVWSAENVLVTRDVDGLMVDHAILEGSRPNGLAGVQLWNSANVSFHHTIFRRADIQITDAIESLEVSESDLAQGHTGLSRFSTGETMLKDVRFCGNVVHNFTSPFVSLSFGDVERLEVVANQFVDNNGAGFTAGIGFFDDGELVGHPAQNVTVLRNEFTRSPAAMAFVAENVTVQNNTMHNLTGTTQFTGKNVDAGWNWWGAPDGPNVLGQNGPGSGVDVEVEGINITLPPFLADPPEAGPAAVDCVPGEGLGAVHSAPVTMGVTASVDAGVQVNEKVGPVHVKAGVQESASVGVGSVGVAEPVPPSATP